MRRYMDRTPDSSHSSGSGKGPCNGLTCGKIFDMRKITLTVIAVVFTLTGCSSSGGKGNYNPGDPLRFEFVRDTFLNQDVKKDAVRFSFEEDSLYGYDIEFVTLPLVVKSGQGYIFAREPFVLVNPLYQVAVVDAGRLEDARYPESFTRDSQFFYLESIWDSLPGKRVFFRMPHGEIISLKFQRVSPDAIILDLGGEPFVIMGYEDKFLNLKDLIYTEPSSLYDTTYHIHFIGTLPALNIYAGWGVAVSIGDSGDVIKVDRDGAVVHENEDGDDFYTDRFISAIGNRWYHLDENHRLVPDEKVYIVKKPDGRLYAFEILSYYHPQDTLKSGYFTIRYGKVK